MAELIRFPFSFTFSENTVRGYIYFIIQAIIGHSFINPTLVMGTNYFCNPAFSTKLSLSVLSNLRSNGRAEVLSQNWVTLVDQSSNYCEVPRFLPSTLFVDLSIGRELTMTSNEA